MSSTQELWELYAHDLQRYIAARVTWPAADDILQQVFLKVHKKISTLEESKTAKQRLYRITQYTIIDRYRKEHNKSISNMDEIFRAWVEDDKESNTAILARNISSCLLPMIQDLSATEQNIINEYLDGSAQKSIAKNMWLSLSNIKTTIHRIKKKLQNTYTQCCYQYKDEQWNLIDTRCSKNCGCENSILSVQD